RRWLGGRVAALDKAVARNGTMALLSLRVTPALPFFAINLAAGISRMRLRVFAPITAIGVLPNKAILTLAGTSLSEIDELSDIFGPRLVLILLALAVFPWIARWTMRRFGATETI
ncbi:MAG: TVP38/TMEM64 family protein, partial [Paracoccus sp. (in: a-proteobacteria)]